MGFQPMHLPLTPKDDQTAFAQERRTLLADGVSCDFHILTQCMGWKPMLQAPNHPVTHDP